MTDTPRTLAQIKAAFANNSTGDISEQDMRDFVESLVNPVAGGGMEVPQPTFISVRQRNGFGLQLAGQFDLYGMDPLDDLAVLPHAGAWIRTAMTPQAGDNIYSDVFDAEGWLYPQEWEDPYFGSTDAPNTLLSLPAGNYIYATAAVTNAQADAEVYIGADTGQLSSGGISDLYPYLSVGARLTSTIGNSWSSVGHLVATVADFKFGPILYHRHSTTDAVCSMYSFQITRIGDA
jgi:hypothetical protein